MILWFYYVAFFFRESTGREDDEGEIDEAMSTAMTTQPDNKARQDSDTSDVEENTVLEEYDLDNYDEDGEG